MGSIVLCLDLADLGPCGGVFLGTTKLFLVFDFFPKNFKVKSAGFDFCFFAKNELRILDMSSEKFYCFRTSELRKCPSDSDFAF